jgi:Txe/YoeB family toxin of Txe-Axe toxin-antitoxin module
MAPSGPWSSAAGSEPAAESERLKPKAQRLLESIAVDRFATPPRYEKLVGHFAGCRSGLISVQRRLA